MTGAAPIAVQYWQVRPRAWPREAPLRIVVLADIHGCDPWMPLGRIREIVRVAGALRGDLVALLGDYVGHMPFAQALDPAPVAEALRALWAPLGVWAVFGNHDWQDDRAAVARGDGQTIWHAAFDDAGLGVLENRSVALEENGHTFRLAGLGSQRALMSDRNRARDGVHDLDAALAGTEPTPTILMAHEPDVFPGLPEHVALTLSGHTHGGQIRLFGWAPVVPSHTDRTFRYGVFAEHGRHLVVSGGLGCSNLPIRLGVPPEITVVDLG
ncbi:MAG: metallophosphoesterase [Pseudomonadota bacterium]